MDKRTFFGVFLILLGVFFFSSRGSVMSPGNVFGYFWPSLFMIPLGILLHWMYFYATQRRGIGLLIPGGILLIGGGICQVSMLFGIWEYMWPGFPLAVAFGLFEFYWFGGRNRWILIPVFILGSVSLIFFTIFTLGTIISFNFLGQTTVAIVLIVLGLVFMFGKKQRNEY
ncbi:hypothetical protein [Paenibacillus sp. SI8]|uniref:hypothetical protein n=1 Tax=unclassified Paenibacillus TaxID=185978 RepID=UPI003467C289